MPTLGAFRGAAFRAMAAAGSDSVVGLLVCFFLLVAAFVAGFFVGGVKGGPSEENLGGRAAEGGAPSPPTLPAPGAGEEGAPPPRDPGALEAARDAEPPAACPDPDFSPLLSHGYPYNFSLESPDPVEVGENRMYSSAEVDPRITGQLFAGARAAGPGRQFIYGNRVSFGDKWGMREFSTGVPGQTGVDVGPLGMCQYSLDGTPDVFDDGIPPEWKMPSTPVNWYKPKGRDYYNVETRGPSVYEPHLMPLSEPDHEPLFG